MTLSITYNRGREGERRQDGQTHNILSGLSIMDQRGGRRDKENEPASVYLIDHVRAVGGCQHGDVPELLHAVHLCQELSQDPVANAARARGAGGTHGNTRRMSGSYGKKEKLMRWTCGRWMEKRERDVSEWVKSRE